MVIARIAYDILSKEDPATLSKAKALLEMYQDQVIKEKESKNFAFVECATWADEIKMRGGSYQSSWHYKNKPFVDDDDSTQQFLLNNNQVSISMAIPNLIKWLKGENIVGTTTHTAIMKSGKNENQGKSIALRMIIHYIGDVHQPLHNLQRYNKQFPKGDMGGNLFKIQNHYSADNLHSVWDQVIYNFRKSFQRPLSQQSWDEIGIIASTLIKQYREPLKYQSQILDHEEMSKESFLIAKTAYIGIVSNQNLPLPLFYIDKFTPIAKERVALAGFRLANLLMDIFRPAQQKNIFHSLFQLLFN